MISIMNLLRRVVPGLLLGAVLAKAAKAQSAGPTNPILFVTQVPIPADFTTIASLFGSQRPEVESCGRGGDLYIRYADGTVRNLTRAAGYGRSGLQSTNGIAVRQPAEAEAEGGGERGCCGGAEKSARKRRTTSEAAAVERR